MEILNNVSKNKAFQQFKKEEDKDFFNYKIDKSLPNHTFVRRDVASDVPRQGTDTQTIKFILPKDGLLGKMLLKLEAVAGTVVFEDKAGINMASEIRLCNPFGCFGKLYPEVLYQKIEELQNDSQRSLMNTLYGDGNNPVCYAPLLFNFSDTVSGFLNCLHDTEYWVECDMVDTTSICSTHTNPVWRASLIAEYVVVPSSVEAQLVKQYPLAKSMTNYNREKTVSASVGVNSVQLKHKGLCSRLYIAVKNTADLDYQSITAVKLVNNGKTVVEFDNLVENQFFSHNYVGVESDVFGSSSSVIWSVNFDISSKKNGYRGGIYLNDNYNEDWRLDVTCAGAGDLLIMEEFYELVRVDKKHGLMRVKAV